MRFAYRLSQVGAEGVLAAGLERVEAAEGTDERILHEVARVGQRARPARQTPVRPAAQPGKVVAHEQRDRTGISLRRAPEKVS